MDRLTYEQLDRIENKQDLILEGLQLLIGEVEEQEEQPEEEDEDTEEYEEKQKTKVTEKEGYRQ